MRDIAFVLFIFSTASSAGILQCCRCGIFVGVAAQHVRLFVGHKREPCKSAEQIKVAFGGWRLA